jgi:hypothetical protein
VYIAAVTALEDVSQFLCLWKTANEVAKRYGPANAAKPREEMEQREYGKNCYTIHVVFKNGRSYGGFLSARTMTPLGTEFRWLRATDVGHHGRRIANAAYCLSLPP